jgi:hypothetical protein
VSGVFGVPDLDQRMRQGIGIGALRSLAGSA